jgi:murein L,D-transpeptidase YafK
MSMKNLPIVLALCWAYAAWGVARVSDHVRVHKKLRKLEILDSRGKILKEYRVALGDSPTGAKVCEGDEKTPEGEYSLDWVNERSRFHRSIHVDYPRSKDREAAKQKSCPPGKDIFLHGTGGIDFGKAHRIVDWTDGCVAVSNGEIDEIIKLLKLPARIEILP